MRTPQRLMLRGSLSFRLGDADIRFLQRQTRRNNRFVPPVDRRDTLAVWTGSLQRSGASGSCHQSGVVLDVLDLVGDHLEPGQRGGPKGG